MSTSTHHDHSAITEHEELPEAYWIVDHEELLWSPGVLIKDVSEEQMHVQCINDEDYYAIDKPAVKVLPLTMESREDLCDLYGALSGDQIAQLNDSNSTEDDDGHSAQMKQSFRASLMHTLRQRFAQNQVHTRLGMQSLISIHHPCPKMEIAQYFFEQRTSAGSSSRSLLHQEGDEQMFEVSEYCSSPSNFAKHVMSVMDLSREDQSILLQGQHSSVLLKQLLEGLLALNLPFSALTPPSEMEAVDQNLLSLVERIQQPISFTVRFKKPKRRDTVNLKPYVAGVDVHALDCVCECNNTFSHIYEFCKELPASAENQFWKDAEEVCQRIAEFCHAFESLKLTENKRPGVLPVIKLAERSQVEEAFLKLSAGEKSESPRRGVLVEVVEGPLLFNLSKPQKLSQVRMTRDAFLRLLKAKFIKWFFNQATQTKNKQVQALLEQNNIDLLQVKLYNQMDPVHPVVNKENEELRIINVISKFKVLQQILKQKQSPNKFTHLQILVDNIMKMPKELLKKGYSISLKSLGEQLNQIFEETRIEDVQKEFDTDDRLGSFQGSEVLSLISNLQSKSELQQSFLLIAKAMVMEQSQTFQSFVKKIKDDTMKQILQTEIRLNEKQHFKEIKNEIDQYFCSYRIISLDPICPRPLNPLVEEPGEAFDSQKILEDLEGYNIQNLIKTEMEMSTQGEIWLHKIQEKILAQQEQERVQENKLKQIQEEQKKRILQTYLQENIQKGIPSTSTKDGIKFLHMIEEEDPLVEQTQRSNKSKDLTMQSRDDKNMTGRSNRQLNEDEEYLFMNLSQNLQELHSTRKETSSQYAQTEKLFLESSQMTQTYARPTKSSAVQCRANQSSVACQQGTSLLLDLVNMSTQTQKSLSYSSQTQTFIQVFDEVGVQTDEDLHYDLRAVHSYVEQLQSELENIQLRHEEELAEKEAHIEKLKQELKELMKQEDQSMQKIRRLEALNTNQALQMDFAKKNTQTQTRETDQSKEGSKQPDEVAHSDFYKNVENEMKEIIENLQKEKELVKLDYENLNTNNCELEQRIQLLSDRQTSRQEVVDNLEAKLKECQNENNLLSQKMDEVQNQLLSSQNKKQALENQNAQFISEIQQLEGEIKVTKYELQKKNEELLERRGSEPLEPQFIPGQVAVENENYNECMALFIAINKILQKEIGLTRSLSDYFEIQLQSNEQDQEKAAAPANDADRINDTFGKLAKTNEQQTGGDTVFEEKSEATVMEKVEDIEQTFKQSSQHSASRRGHGTNALNDEDGESTNRIGGGLSMASSQMMKFSQGKLSSRRNVLQDNFMPDQSQRDLKSFRSKRNSDSWSEGELTKMNLEPEQTKQTAKDFFRREGSEYSSGHEANVSPRSGDSLKDSTFFEKKEGIDMHKSRKIRNSFAEKRQKVPEIIFPQNSRLFASKGVIDSIDESLNVTQRSPEYLKRAILLCQEKIQQLEEKLMTVMQKLRTNGPSNESFYDEGLKSNIEQFKNLYSSGQKKQANYSIQNKETFKPSAIVRVDQIGRLQSSAIHDQESNDCSEFKRQLTNIEYNDSQSQVFMETEQSNPFSRKITTNFHDADDVELLNNMEERPAQQKDHLQLQQQYSRISSNSKLSSIGYRPLMKRNFSKATSIVSDQSYLGNINNVNDQLNDELTKLAQNMQMFEDQKSVSDVQSQLESRRGTFQNSSTMKRMMQSGFQSSGRRTILSHRDLVNRSGRNKDEFKDTLASHISKDFNSEGVSNSDEGSRYSLEHLPDNEHDLEDYDDEDVDEDFSEKNGEVDPHERRDTHESGFKLNIFQPKKSNSLLQDAAQHQRSFLPKRSRKLSPSQTTDLRSQQIQKLRASRQSNRADTDVQ